MSEEVAETLQKALDLFEDGRGWVKRMAYIKSPETKCGFKFCTAGAIAVASSAIDIGNGQIAVPQYTSENMRLNNLCCNAIEDIVGGAGVTKWNDSFWRSFKDVEKAFKKAIKKAKES